MNRYTHKHHFYKSGMKSFSLVITVYTFCKANFYKQLFAMEDALHPPTETNSEKWHFMNREELVHFVIISLQQEDQAYLLVNNNCAEYIASIITPS